MDHVLVVHSQYARYNSTNPRRLDELADAILAISDVLTTWRIDGVLTTRRIGDVTQWRRDESTMT